MPMTQNQHLMELFRLNGGRISLGAILQTNLAAAYRGRISDLRKELIPKGMTIICIKGKTPSENIYELKRIQPDEPKLKPVTFGYEGDQAAFA